MSWDSLTLAIVAAVWVILGFVYAYGIGMMPGARAWWSGGILLAALVIGMVQAERRAAARRQAGRADGAEPERA